MTGGADASAVVPGGAGAAAAAAASGASSASTSGVEAAKVGEGDGSKKSRMKMEIFVEAMTYSAPSLDRLDRDLFHYLIFGRVPDALPRITREYFADRTTFHFTDKTEMDLSNDRRNRLRQAIQIPAHSSSTTSMKSAERKALATEFWVNVVEGMSASLENSASSKEVGGKVIQRVKTVSKATFTTITWEIYRELLLTAMEKYLAAEHVRLCAEIKAARKAPKSQLGRRSLSTDISPFDGFEMYSMDPTTGNVVKAVSTTVQPHETTVEDDEGGGLTTTSK